MSARDEGERTEQATPKRLEDARSKGEGPRSPDLAVALSFAGAAAFCLWQGPDALARSGAALAALVEGGAQGEWPGRARIIGTVAPLAGLLALPAALVLGGLAAQRSVVVAPAKLAFKPSRLSVLSNAKQKFGPSGLFEFAKAALKLALVCGAAGVVAAREIDRIALSPALPAAPAALLPLELAMTLLVAMALLTAPIAAADLLWQRFDFGRRNRMSRQETKDEAKEAEGDPHIKAQRRARAQGLATGPMLAEVAKADVVVVNPVHFAVALRWSREPGTAPVCVAKGRDEVALRIRRAAEQAGVPVRHDPPVARALHAAASLGAEVPPDTWRAVATLIRFADRVRAARGRA